MDNYRFMPDMHNVSWLTAFNYQEGHEYDISYRGQPWARYLYSGYVDGRYVFTRFVPGTRIRDTYRFSSESHDVCIVEACGTVITQ